MNTHYKESTIASFSSDFEPPCVNKTSPYSQNSNHNKDLIKPGQTGHCLLFVMHWQLST